MLKSALKRRLKFFGEVPAPEGHAAYNKGVSTLFLVPNAKPHVENILLEQGLTYQGVLTIYSGHPEQQGIVRRGLLSNGS